MYNFNNLSPLADYIHNEDILSKILELLQRYLQKYSKAYVVRFDLTFPVNYPHIVDNSYLSKTIAYIAKKFSRYGYSPEYLWVMEQNSSSHPHYHCVFLLDGQKVRSYKHLLHEVEIIWSRTLGVDATGLVDHCDHHSDGTFDPTRNGICIRRCDAPEVRQQQLQNVYRQISYLAKEETKIFTKDGLRNFGTSRLSKV